MFTHERNPHKMWKSVLFLSPALFYLVLSAPLVVDDLYTKQADSSLSGAVIEPAEKTTSAQECLVKCQNLSPTCVSANIVKVADDDFNCELNSKKEGDGGATMNVVTGTEYWEKM